MIYLDINRSVLAVISRGPTISMAALARVEQLVELSR